MIIVGEGSKSITIVSGFCKLHSGVAKGVEQSEITERQIWSSSICQVFLLRRMGVDEHLRPLSTTRSKDLFLARKVDGSSRRV